jgi:hypothetical protein
MLQGEHWVNAPPVPDLQDMTQLVEDPSQLLLGVTAPDPSQT